METNETVITIIIPDKAPPEQIGYALVQMGKTLAGTHLAIGVMVAILGAACIRPDDALALGETLSDFSKRILERPLTMEGVAPFSPN